MAISPEEVLKRTDEEHRQIDSWECVIDDALRRGIENRQDSVAVDVPQGATRRVLLEITRRYIAAGWNVKYESDQREGSWLEFSPK